MPRARLAVESHQRLDAESHLFDDASHHFARCPVADADSGQILRRLERTVVGQRALIE